MIDTQKSVSGVRSRMMLTIVQAQMPERAGQVCELFWEFLRWGDAMLRQEYGIELDVKAMLENDMTHIDKYAPPMGCLMLAEMDDALVGCACMRNIGQGMCDLKRMYVRPAHRGKGIGRALLTAVLDRAGLAGYSRMRLDSVRFMREAHSLYRSAGFREIGPYDASEIPERYRDHWVFMEKML
jgi:GNAT superfamily N-acetyltransferase